MPECLVGQIMTSALQYVYLFDKVIDVARQMYQCGIGSVLIKRKGSPTGILTERDIVRSCIVGDKNIFNAKVEEIMTEPIILINKNKSVIEACDLMRQKGVKKLPTMNDKKEIIGIITMTDIVHNIDTFFPQAKKSPIIAKDIMAKHLFYCDQNDRVIDVTALMKRVNVGSIVVMNKGVPVGVLTERDIVKSCVLGEKNFAKVKTDEIMSSPIITVKQSLPIVDVAHLMKQKNIKKLPARNEAGRLVGMVTQTDIVYNMPALVQSVGK